MTIELFISRRYFKSKPKQAIIALITILSMCGIAIGVTALIVVIGVMAGFEQDLKTRIMGIEPHLLIDRMIDRKNATIADYTDDIQEIKTIPGVTAAWPLVELQAMLRTDARTAGAVIKGVDPSAAAEGLNLPVLKRLAAPLKKPADATVVPPIVLGRDLAGSMGLIKGDIVYVVSPKGTLTPTGYVPLMKRFIVADFFETGMYEYDGSLAFIHLKNAQTLARSKDSVTALEIRVDKVLESDTIAAQLRDRFDSSFRLRDWRQMNQNLFSALKLEKAGMFITLTLIILVATFSIVSSLVMMVMEKTRDIAILRTLGATRRTIKRIFIFQGLLIGTVGTASGVFLGSLLCYLQMTFQWIHLPGDGTIYYITALPVDLQITDVLMVALASMVICFGATLYPALQASRLNPVEAIRYG